MTRARGRSLAAAALLVALVLPGCPGPRTKPRATRSPSALPVPRGGTLVVAYPHEPATLNPFIRGNAPPTTDLVRPLMPSLWRLEPGGKRSRSLLAADPAVEPGSPFAVSLALRPDARWSDGVAITASDLRFTWRTIMDRRWPIATRDGYDQIADVIVVAPTQARVVFKQPFARWDDLFRGVLPAHALSAARFDRALASAWPVSGGPFVLQSWKRGLEIVYARNPRAWGEAPALDRIVVRFVPDVVTALQLLRRGEVDALGPYPGVDLQRRAALVPGATATSDLGATWAALLLNTRTPVLADARVRRALAYAIDRRGIVEGLVRAEGKPWDALTTAGQTPSPGFATYRRNTATAARLLGEAGWRTSGGGPRTKGGRDLHVTLAAIGLDELPGRVLRALHAQAAEVGFDLDVVSLEPAELWRDWLWGSRFEAAFVVLRDPPGGALRSRFESTRRPPAGKNLSRVADATVDGFLRALDEGASPSPGAEAQAERRLAALVPAIPLYRAAVVVVSGPAAGGLRANASADGFLWNAALWYRAAGSPTPAS